MTAAYYLGLIHSISFPKVWQWHIQPSYDKSSENRINDHGVKVSFKACDADILHSCIWLSINPLESTLYMIELQQRTKTWCLGMCNKEYIRGIVVDIGYIISSRSSHLSYEGIFGFHGNFRTPPLSILAVIIFFDSSITNGSNIFTYDWFGSNFYEMRVCLLVVSSSMIVHCNK